MEHVECCELVPAVCCAGTNYLFGATRTLSTYQTVTMRGDKLKLDRRE